MRLSEIRWAKLKLPFVTAESLLSHVPKIDLHIHTSFVDGEAGIKEIIQYAEHKGLQTIAFTEHARRSSTYLPEYLGEIKLYAFQTGIKVLKGVEVKIINLSGEIDVSPGVIDDLDIILGVIHRFPVSFREPIFAPKGDITADHAVEIEELATINMIKKGYADVVSHPGRIFEEQFGIPFPIPALDNIVLAAKQHRVAIELNSKAPNFPTVLRVCLKHNCLVSPGSDAHILEEIGSVTTALSDAMPRLRGDH